MRLYIHGLLSYWSIVSTIYLGLILMSGYGHRLRHFLEWPTGIAFLSLGIFFILLLNLFLMIGFKLIIKWMRELKTKSRVALILFGTYWYNILLIPISIIQVIAQGYTENLLAIFAVGPIFFLLPSIAFISSYNHSKS